MKLAIFGYGGHAREVAAQIDDSVVFFVDDEYVTKDTMPISKFDPQIYKILISVAEPKERKRIVESLPKETKYFTFIHPTALLMADDIEIGEGSFIGAYSILTTNIKIGKHAILNRMVQIGHDTSVGDYFSAMPGSVISGNVTVGDFVYMGNNSSVREKIQITSDVKIGANGCVVTDLITGGIYVGVPAKFIKK